MNRDLKRHIITVIAAATGILTAVVGPVIAVQHSPLVTHRDCKFPFSTVGQCSRITHNLNGWYMTAMLGTLIGGLLIVLGSVIIDIIITEYEPRSDRR